MNWMSVRIVEANRHSFLILTFLSLSLLLPLIVPIGAIASTNENSNANHFGPDFDHSEVFGISFVRGVEEDNSQFTKAVPSTDNPDLFNQNEFYCSNRENTNRQFPSLVLSSTQVVSNRIESPLENGPPSEGDWIISSPVVIDGGVFNVNGSIIITSPESVTFKNTELDVNGVVRLDSDNHIFVNNSVSIHEAQGVLLNGSSGIIFTNNTIRNSMTEYTSYGVSLFQSHNNTFINNTIISEGLGGYLLDSDSNIFTGNTITGKAIGVKLGEFAIGFADRNTFTNNTIISLGTENANNSALRVYGDYNTFEGNSVSGIGYGMWLEGGDTDENSFTNNQICGNIYFVGNRNTLVNNTIFGAICIESIQNNNIFIDNIISSHLSTVYIQGKATDNYFYNNTIISSSEAIKLNEGIRNIFINNTISAPQTVSLIESTGNIFVNNQISSDFGQGEVTLTGSTNNSFHYNQISGSVSISTESNRNEFLFNYFKAWVINDGTENMWNRNGLGNFWVKYVGPDSDGDGIGDIPHSIVGSASSADQFPLMISHLSKVIFNHPKNLSIREGSIGNEIVWDYYSGHSYPYRVLHDNTPILVDSLKGSNFVLDVDWLNIGIHNLTITADLGNEIVSDTVLVVVNSRQAPLVTILFPNGGEVLNETVMITWNVFNLNGDSLTFSVSYSNDSGVSWIRIVEGIGAINFVWDTTTIDNGHSYLIKIEVEDDAIHAFDLSDDTFSIANTLTTPSSQTLITPGFTTFCLLVTLLGFQHIVKTAKKRD